jgi:RpiR family transcriptional regulator, carbohydrate utilization regulator
VTETFSLPDETILSRIRYLPSGLSAIEAQIAAGILEEPDRVLRESITTFARRTSVSTGSVVRFAKLLGLGGYADLKLAIATATAQGRNSPARRANGSRFSSYMDEQVRAMLFAREEIEPMRLEAAAAVLVNARRVDIAATGSSLQVAHGLLFSLTLLGLHVRFLPDTSEQAAAAAFIGPGDCLIAVSFSGKTRAIVDAASRASHAGATVIALTCSANSPLIQSASLALMLDARRGKFTTEWPLRTAMVAVGRALMLYVADQLSEGDLNHRRSTWSSGRFGLRYQETTR